MLHGICLYRLHDVTSNLSIKKVVYLHGCIHLRHIVMLHIE